MNKKKTVEEKKPLKYIR
jgi:hypothetical protein